MTNFIIGPDGDGGWKATKQGNERASFKGGTQSEVYDKARDDLKSKSGGEITIQGRDGIIRDKNTISPAKDPRNTPG